MSVSFAVALEISEKTGYHLNICKAILEENGFDKQATLDELASYKTLAKEEKSVEKKSHSEIFSYYDAKSQRAVLVKAASPDSLAFTYPDFMDSVDAIVYDLAENEHPKRIDEILADLRSGFNPKIEIDYRRIEKINADQELLTTYVHEAKIGAIVKLSLDRGNLDLLQHKKIKQFAFDIAMHIVAFNPIDTIVSKLPTSLNEKLVLEIESELAISGKEMNLWETIIEGKLKKICDQNSLYSQIFIKSDKETVSEVLASIEKELDCDISINDFTRLEV